MMHCIIPWLVINMVVMMGVIVGVIVSMVPIVINDKEVEETESHNNTVTRATIKHWHEQ